MSKTEFRLMIDSEVKQRFKAACDSLNPSPAMTSEISEFMEIYADYVEKTGKRPHITSISHEYDCDIDVTSNSHGYDMSNYVSRKDYLDLVERIEALENQSAKISPEEENIQTVEEMSGNDRLENSQSISNSNNGESHHNQTIQSSLDDGHINTNDIPVSTPTNDDKKITEVEEDTIIIGSDYTTVEQVQAVKISPKHRLQQAQMGLRLGLTTGAKNVPTKDKRGELADPAKNNDPEGLGWEKLPRQQGRPVLYKPIFFEVKEIVDLSENQHNLFK